VIAAGVRWAAPLVLLAAVLQPAVPAAQPAALSEHEFHEHHMGTMFRIVLHATSRSVAERASARAFARIAELDARFSDYRHDSEVNRVSRDAVDRPVEVSGDLFDVLSTAQAMSVQSGGAFDVTAGALTHLWRRARRLGRLPAAADIETARRTSGYDALVLDAAARTVRLLRRGMRLDLGGIGKGYAADAALAELRGAGVTRALVAAGGDIAAGDAPPDAQGWTVRLAAFEGEAPGSPLVLVRAAVSTSGDTEQWLEADGVRYSHIVDPRTGRALTERRLASVVARKATTSDMLATAVSVAGVKEGVRLVEGTPGAALLMGVERRGEVEWTASARWTQ
jgi:thiamine biosynthesis lipoprotein